MRVLGLVASYRRMGNSEVLLREALLEARRRGAEVAMIRLTDLRVEPCKGCMACIFKGEPCRIEDDVDFVLDEMEGSDGVILSSPTYMLSPPGIVKMLLDRMITLQEVEKIRALAEKRRFGAVIGVATNPEGWAPFTIPMLRTLLQAAQIRVVDSMMAAAAGPGEVLLDEAVMRRARLVGARLVDAIEGRLAETPPDGSTCPLCKSNIIIWRGAGLVECPTCGIKGRVTMRNGEFNLEFPEEELEKCRWTPEMAIRHTVEEIMPTAARYLKNLGEIRRRVEKYESEPITVIKPASKA